MEMVEIHQTASCPVNNTGRNVYCISNAKLVALKTILEFKEMPSKKLVVLNSISFNKCDPDLTTDVDHLIRENVQEMPDSCHPRSNYWQRGSERFREQNVASGDITNQSDVFGHQKSDTDADVREMGRGDASTRK